MSNSLLNNTPSELHLYTSDGKECVYQMSGLTYKDQSELDDWAQARFIDNVRRSLPDGLPEAQWKSMMALAMAESLGIRFSSRPGSRLFTTTKGIARLAWQGIKRNHKDVTVDELHELMFDPKNVLEVHQHYDKVNDVQIEKRKDGGKADTKNFPSQSENENKQNDMQKSSV